MKANRLSRRLNQKVETENNNSNQVIIKDYWICSLLEVIIEIPEIKIEKR